MKAVASTFGIVGMLVLMCGFLIWGSTEDAGSSQEAAERNAPYGATQIELVGNGWFTYCFDGVKMLQYYRNDYKEGYVAISALGECN